MSEHDSSMPPELAKMTLGELLYKAMHARIVRYENRLFGHLQDWRKVDTDSRNEEEFESCPNSIHPS